MEKGLFRKKSLERISSPEELHDYMRVTTPRLWMILSAILLLLVGFIVYASTAVMENTAQIKLEIEQYPIPSEDENTPAFTTNLSAELPQSMKEQVNIGMVVRLGDEDVGTVQWIGIINSNQVYLLIEPKQYYLPVPAGEYDAELVLESTTPISFLWN